MSTLLLVSIIVLAIVIWVFNLLVKDRNQVLAAWSDIDVQLKRRHDLIPQLVTTVKAYADFEQATMTAVFELRTRSQAAAHLPEKAALEDQMVSAIGALVVLAEDYSDLKADTNFRQLQSDLTEIEHHIQYARRFYNGAVKIFNIRIQSFPNVLIARLLRFREAEFFEVSDPAERHNPAVEID
ncbi:MAG: LemA family protein [Proteobacteria bacterium]|nr:LemA family protein [Pseudomonadota bacterium]